MIVFEEWALRLIGFLSALVIVAIAEPRINAINQPARPIFRAGFVLLAAGGVWQILHILAGDIPPWPIALLQAGAAMLLWEERYCPRSCARGSGIDRATADTIDVDRRRRKTTAARHGPHSISDPPRA